MAKASAEGDGGRILGRSPPIDRMTASPLDSVATVPGASLTAARVLLAFMGATTLIMGCLYLIAPQELAAVSGLAITRPAAEAELRGYYGGLQLGMGVLFFAGVLRLKHMRAGLTAAAVLFAGNGLGRVLGIALAGAIDSFNASGVVFEFMFAGAAIAILRSPAFRSPA